MLQYQTAKGGIDRDTTIQCIINSKNSYYNFCLGNVHVPYLHEKIGVSQAKLYTYEVTWMVGEWRFPSCIRKHTEEAGPLPCHNSLFRFIGSAQISAMYWLLLMITSSPCLVYFGFTDHVTEISSSSYVAQVL